MTAASLFTGAGANAAAAASGAEAMDLLHVYAELAAADASAAERYPGIAAHLQACGPCGEDFDGLLAAMRGAAN